MSPFSWIILKRKKNFLIQENFLLRQQFEFLFGDVLEADLDFG